MSMEIMVLVNKHKFDSPLKKLIFLQLADNADKSGKCWPSYSYIADTSGCGKSTVRKHIKELADLGYLSVTNRKGEKGNASNIYVINKAALCDTPMLRGSTPPMPPDSIGVCHEVAQGMPPDSTPLCHQVAPESVTLEPVNESVKKKTKKKAPDKKADLSEIEPPENLNMKVWHLWVDYKKQIKKPYKTPMGIKTAMTQLAALPYDNQKACIENSIQNEYQGFFPEKYLGHNNGNQHNQKSETVAERANRLSSEHSSANMVSHVIDIPDKLRIIKR